MLNATSGDDNASIRDHAILRLMADLGLRRGEVARLDFPIDLDAKNRKLWVLGKGRTQKEKVHLPEETAKALGKWIQVREILRNRDGLSQTGPLFTSFDSSKKGQSEGRLDGSSIYRIVRKYGELAGAGHVRPHGIRHTAITEALDTFNGDLRKVRRFSRHRSIATLQIYDDNRTDFAAEISDALAKKFNQKLENK
jgi:integrase/recombinase XerC